MAATLWKIYDFFVREPDGRDEKPDSEKSIDVRVPCGRDEKPYSEKSVDLRVPSGRDSQKSVDLRVAYGRGEKPDSEERFMSNPFLPLKYKLKAVKVYTRHVGQEVFWDKKLGRHRTFKELQKDPEIRREIKEYIICRGLEQFGMNLEKLLGFVNDKELNFRINAESCWDSMELEHPATLEELGMDPENKGIISDFLRFVRDKELCKSDWMNEKLINWLVYDSPSTNRSSVIAAMANYLKFNVYHLDLTSFSSFDELEYTLLSTRNRSVIAIEGLYQCAGMLLNLKTDDKFAVKHLLNEIDALFLGHNNERIFVFTINHRDQHVAASLHPVGMDFYIHTSLPQPIALPDGGERTLHNSLLPSNSEKENTREAYDSTKRYSLLNFDATKNKAVKVYSRQGRDCSHPMELEQPPTLAELGKDPENEGIISDLLSFVRDKELYKRIGKKWKRGYLLHDSPGIDRSSLIAAMANYLELDIYDLDLTGLSSIWELQNVLLRNRNRSLIAIKDFNHWFGMHPNLKNEVLSLRKEKELTLSGLLEIIDGLVSCCWDQQIIVLTANHNQRDRFHTALLHPLNINAYMHTSSPQPLVLPNGGEILEFDSSEQKPLADFDATNKKAYQSGVLVFHSEKENTREASKEQCMTESALSLVDSTTRISSTDFNAPNYRADLVRAYRRDPFTLNSEKKDMTEGLSGECLSNSVLRDDDSTKRNSLPNCTSLAPFLEIIEDFDNFDDGAGMLPNLKDEATLGLPDGGHIPSLPEKKIVRKTLKRKSRTMSVISLEDHQQHVGRRWEDDTKFLGAKQICRQLAIDCKPTEKRILKQHGTRRCQSKQSAIDLPDGGHTLSLSKKKIVRKTLKRKYRNMSVLRSEYHQHVDSKWDDSVKSLGAKHIYRQLVIHRVSRAKRIRRQHGFHRWPFQQNWATLKGYFLGDERPVAVISLSIDGKLVSRLLLIHISSLGRFSPRPPALPPGGEIVGSPLALSSSQLPSTSNRAQLGGQDRSGSTASHSQNERTRDQPEGRKRKIKHFTIEDLRPLVHLSREDAAKELGVSVTTFKRRRKNLGIVRWPILPPKEVFIPPDPDGENNPPPTSNMLSTNGQITMEIEMGGPNSEPNERLPNSFEDPNFQNMGNGSIAEFENPTTFYDSHHGHDRDADFLFPAVFNGTEAAGGSGYLWEQGFESSDPMFLVYSDAAAPSQAALAIPPTMPPPQIASTQIPRENMHEDRRSFLAPQEEPLPEGHVFGSVNCTSGSISDLAPSQDMPTAADTMESSEYFRDPLASVVGHRMENNHYRPSNLIDASCSNLASSQTMQPTISHMTPLLTERQDSRFVKLDAACDEDLINLYLPLMPGIMELKQAVSVQLGLGLDRFKVKYKDGRGKWILMTHDEDVRELRRLTSSENQDSNRLEVIKVSNTTYLCRNCQCRIT